MRFARFNQAPRRSPSRSIFLPNFLAKDFTAAISGTSGQTDPDLFLYTTFHSTSAGNYMNFANAELDALLTAGRQEPDPEARRAIYPEAQEIVFLFHSAQYSANRPNVEGDLDRRSSARG